MKSRYQTFALMAALAIAEAAHGQNLIDKTYGPGAGDFELGSFTGGNVSQILPAGSTNIIGWAVEENGIDWCPPDFGNVSSGMLAIDLNGHFQSGGGAVRTTVPTVPGHVYEVAYDVSAFIHFISPTETKRAEVTAGNVTNQIAVTGPVIQATPIPLTWTRNRFHFTAQSPNSTVRFKSLTPDDASGVLLDNVSVTDVGPALAPVEVRFGKGGVITICWPAELVGYTLQGSRNVNSQNPERTRWVVVTNAPVCDGLTCCVTTTVSEYGKHFRLVKE
jgi:hypothetical protein